MKKDIFKKYSEKGVALLFSLGILGLMTVLALTFASVSVTNQTIAKNFSNTLSARILADSIIDRVKFAAGVYNSSTADKVVGPGNFKCFFSKAPDSDTNNTGTFDWIWKLGLTGKNMERALYDMETALESHGGSMTYNPTDNPTWQYVHKDSSDSTSDIIGRFAFVVVGADLPLIDFNTLLLKEDGSSNISGEYKRFGMSLEELNPANLVTAIDEPTININNTGAVTAIGNDNKKRFTQLNELYTYLTDTTEELKRKQADIIVNKFVNVNNVKYPEAFVVKNGASYDKYHRFDVSKINSTTYSSFDARKALVDEMLGGTSKIYTWAASDTDSNPQLPWLANMSDTEGGYAAAGSLTAEKVKAAQIAANIVDFFTEGINVTSDKEPSSWSVTGDSPIYTGLKKTPYICSVAVRTTITVTQTKTDPDSDGNVTHTFQITVSADPQVEIINMFNDLETKNISVELSIADFSFDLVEGEGENTQTFTFKTKTADPINNHFISGETTFPADTEKFFRKGITFSDSIILDQDTYSFQITDTNNTFLEKTFKITKFKFSPHQVLLKYDGVPVDFASLSVESTGSEYDYNGETGIEPIKTGTTEADCSPSKKYFLTYRVSDPRHNLIKGAWTNNKKFEESTNDSIVDITYTPENTASKDANVDTSIIYASNPYYPPDIQPEDNKAFAYIPQKQIASPWEIGAIHRGAAWQTFNLLKYNTTQGATATGATTYDAGDAQLLDQIKVTNKTFQYGKININELFDTNYSALKALLVNTTNKNCTTSSSGDKTMLKRDAGETDSEREKYLVVNEEAIYPKTVFENDTQIQKFKEAFFKRRCLVDSTLPPYYISRSEILRENDIVTMFENSNTNDADREEIFTKIAMLLEADLSPRPRRLYVIGIAQTISDRKGTFYKDWNENGSLTESATTATGKYNAGYKFPRPTSGYEINGGPTPSSPINPTPTIGKYDNGADAITGEQKVFAVLERDWWSDKWKIVRFEYVN